MNQEGRPQFTPKVKSGFLWSIFLGVGYLVLQTVYWMFFPQEVMAYWQAALVILSFGAIGSGVTLLSVNRFSPKLTEWVGTGDMIVYTTTDSTTEKETTTEEVSENNTETGTYCPSCGNEVDGESDFCRHCGESLTNAPEGREPEPLIDSGEVSQQNTGNDSNGFQQLGYWGGRVGQVVLVALAVIFLIGGLEMNILAFATIGIFALVLLGGVGVIELLIIRPMS